MRVLIPAVPVADHRDALRIGRSYREMRAGDAIALSKAAAELLVQPCVGAFPEQIDVVLGQQDVSPIGLPSAARRRGRIGARRCENPEPGRAIGETGEELL